MSVRQRRFPCPRCGSENTRASLQSVESPPIAPRCLSTSGAFQQVWRCGFWHRSKALQRYSLQAVPSQKRVSKWSFFEVNADYAVRYPHYLRMAMKQNGQAETKFPCNTWLCLVALDLTGLRWMALIIIDYQQHSAIDPGRPFSRPLAGLIFSMQSYYLTEHEFFTD